MKRLTQTGFTIIELMIASLVFSVILVVITTGVMSFTNSYYRGLTVSKTQLAAQNIIDTVSQAIQFSSTTFGSATGNGGTMGAYCIGNQQFSFVLGKQLAAKPTSYQTNHAFWQDAVSGAGGCAVTQFTPTSREMLPEHMRVANFSITQLQPTNSNLYTVTVRVVYGDDDLLNNPNGPDATCKSGMGSQFCAVSQLSTTVQMRKKVN